MTLNKKCMKILEENEVYVSSYTNDGRVELEWFTPAGEDFLICAEVKDFPRSFKEFSDDFDVDEHIEMLMEAKRNGVSGIPSVRRLVEDAEAISDFLESLSVKLCAA